MDGLILIDKPQNITSHQIVLEIRKILNIPKVGHYGTLDPMATGLIMIAVGKATRLFPFFSKKDKVYEGQIRLGFSTDTYDAQGKPTSAEKADFPPKNYLQKVMKKFEGEMDQVPPLFSAKKYKGKPLYTLARKKKEFELKASRVFIYFFRLTSYHPPYAGFQVKCSAGTYIRSLTHDLGQALGCGAHLSQLKRIEVGEFHLKHGFSLEEIEGLVEEEEIDECLIPMEALLPGLSKIILDEKGSALAKNGNLVLLENILKMYPPEDNLSVSSDEKEEIFRLFSLEGKLLALARKTPERNGLHPFLVLHSKEVNQ